MDFSAWKVDLPSRSAIHITGFKIAIEGSACNPTGVTPGKFPENLSAIEQATLLRSGLEALSKASQKYRLLHAESGTVPATHWRK